MTPAKFRNIRLELGLNQKELAEILCVSQPMVVSHYETGFRKPSKLIQVVMSILEALPEKKRRELLDLIRNQIKRVDSPVKKIPHGKG